MTKTGFYRQMTAQIEAFCNARMLHLALKNVEKTPKITFLSFRFSEVSLYMRMVMYLFNVPMIRFVENTSNLKVCLYFDILRTVPMPD